MKSRDEFFIVNSAPGEPGVPYFFDKDWMPDLPDCFADFYTSPLDESMFSGHYALRAKTYQLNGDFFIDDHLASRQMCDMCARLDVDYIHIPVDVSLYRGKVPEKKYFLFFLKKYISILDADKSIYKICSDSEGLEHTYYDSIDLFKIRGGVVDNLFFCKELMMPVCSGLFKDECEKLGLTGFAFQPLDDTYRYSAWDDLDLA